MPQRSNEFQTLIKLIESQLAPKEATVTESKSLIDRRSGVKREVDILIEVEVGGHPVVIAVECRDHGRKADHTWIDQLCGKYQHLPVHKVIAVSRSGFYKSAAKAARESDIEILTLEAAQEADWLRAVHAQDEFYFTSVRFVPVDAEVVLGINSRHQPSNLFIEDSGKYSVSKFMSKMIQGANPIANSICRRLIQEYDSKAGLFRGGNTFTWVNCKPKEPWQAVDDLDQRYLVEGAVFKFECRVDRFTIKTEKYSYAGRAQIATVTKEFPGMQVTLTITEREDKQPTAGLVIKGPDGRLLMPEIISQPIPEPTGAVHLSFYNIAMT